MLIIDKLVVKQRPEMVHIRLASGEVLSWPIDNQNGCIIETGSVLFKISFVSRPQAEQQQDDNDDAFESINDKHKSYIIRVDSVVPWQSLKQIDFVYPDVPVLELDKPGALSVAAH